MDGRRRRRRRSSMSDDYNENNQSQSSFWEFAAKDLFVEALFVDTDTTKSTSEEKKNTTTIETDMTTTTMSTKTKTNYRVAEFGCATGGNSLNPLRFIANSRVISSDNNTIDNNSTNTSSRNTSGNNDHDQDNNNNNAATTTTETLRVQPIVTQTLDILLVDRPENNWNILLSTVTPKAILQQHHDQQHHPEGEIQHQQQHQASSSRISITIDTVRGCFYDQCAKDLSVDLSYSFVATHWMKFRPLPPQELLPELDQHQIQFKIERNNCNDDVDVNDDVDSPTLRIPSSSTTTSGMFPTCPTNNNNSSGSSIERWRECARKDLCEFVAARYRELQVGGYFIGNFGCLEQTRNPNTTNHYQHPSSLSSSPSPSTNSSSTPWSRIGKLVHDRAIAKLKQQLLPLPLPLESSSSEPIVTEYDDTPTTKREEKDDKYNNDSSLSIRTPIPIQPQTQPQPQISHCFAKAFLRQEQHAGVLPISFRTKEEIIEAFEEINGWKVLTCKYVMSEDPVKKLYQEQTQKERKKREQLISIRKTKSNSTTTTTSHKTNIGSSTEEAEVETEAVQQRVSEDLRRIQYATTIMQSWKAACIPSLVESSSFLYYPADNDNDGTEEDYESNNSSSSNNNQYYSTPLAFDATDTVTTTATATTNDEGVNRNTTLLRQQVEAFWDGVCHECIETMAEERYEDEDDENDHDHHTDHDHDASSRCWTSSIEEQYNLGIPSYFLLVQKMF